MLNSRKLFKALAVTGLLTLGSVASYAQICSGAMTTTNLGVRPEGLTELTGDIQVTCTSGTVPANGFSVLVTLTSGVTVTNTTTIAPTLNGTGVTPVVSFPAGLPNGISFQIPTGATGSTFTINGIRINANAAVAASISQVYATLIITTVTSTGTTVLPLSGNPGLVATILPKSLNFSVVGGSNANATGGAASFPTCIGGNSVSGFFRFTENFTNVLRTFSVTPAVNEEGPNATNGTQLRVVLSGVPANVTVLVPTGTITTGNSEIIAVSGVGSASSATLSTGYTSYAGPGSGRGVGVAPPVGGPIEPVYSGSYGAAGAEVIFNVNTTPTGATGSSTATLDAITIPFIVLFAANPNVGIGTAAAKGTLAPINSTTAIPRFVDSGDSANAFSTSVCSTTLLYPYVTSDAGFDTGVAISNTTADPAIFGTPNQSGTCTITPYGAFGSGASLPAAGTTPAISAGRTWAFSLTDSAVFGSGAKLGAGFNGYLIAQCNFQLAHGYAFISTYGLAGSNSVAQGYLALILNQNDGSRVSGATIERLVH